MIKRKFKTRKTQNLKSNTGQIVFENINFNYNVDEQQILNSVNLNFPGQTQLIDTAELGNQQF